MEYITHSPEETEALGAEYAKLLHPGDVVACSIEGIGTLTNTVR